ncbi:hypothetical protein KY285_008738 [Solanum tuberosum]|nr:hypothetical protein KY285_008738 [Solanum tuberosum]
MRAGHVRHRQTGVYKPRTMLVGYVGRRLTDVCKLRTMLAGYVRRRLNVVCRPQMMQGSSPEPVDCRWIARAAPATRVGRRVPAGGWTGNSSFGGLSWESNN